MQNKDNKAEKLKSLLFGSIFGVESHQSVIKESAIKSAHKQDELVAEYDNLTKS